MTVATVLIPTWRGSATIGGALASARNQTISDIEILVVGDGIDEETRSVIAEHIASDARVRLLDLPKGENRGERNRHLGVLEASAPCIFYLADDDLLLPRHVENLLPLLERAFLAQSANAFVDDDNRIRLWPTDLSDPRWVAWHLLDPPRNRVSITGTAHTVESYRRLERGWDVDPAVPWTDLALWRQFFTLPDFVGATHPEVTTLQFPASGLAARDPDGALTRFAAWQDLVEQPTAQEQLNALVTEARSRALIEYDAQLLDQRIANSTLRQRLSSSMHTADDFRQQIHRLEQTLRDERNTHEAAAAATAKQIAQVEKRLRNALQLAQQRGEELQQMRASRSWRITQPLRSAAARLNRSSRTEQRNSDS